MATAVENPSATTEAHGVPRYAHELAAFHRAFAGELRAVIATLPVSPTMQVIDVGCGDGFYVSLFAERLRAPGSITGFDSNAEYLKLAGERLTSQTYPCHISIVQGQLEQIDALAGQFDLVWCAQSLFSLPEPVVALRHMAALLRPGGLLFVLENDMAHQLLLPWPSRLELAVKHAELAALGDATARPEKYFVGRRLPELFVAAGLEPMGTRSQSIDRQSPFDHDLMEFLGAYLARLSERVAPYLDAETSQELKELLDAKSESCLLHQPFTNVTWLNKLAWARKAVIVQNNRPGGSQSTHDAKSQGRAAPREENSRQQVFRDGFHLKSSESTGKGVRRLLRRQIDNLNYLLEQARSGDDCVHDIRKTFKKARALLRLARSDLGREVYERENACLRDAARAYRDVRDAQVLVSCFDQVGKVHRHDVDDPLWNQIHERLVADAQQAVIALASRNPFEATAAAVNGFGSRLDDWKPSSHDFSDVLRGARKTYRSGRRAFHQAGDEPSVENLHEWRKQAKYLWHELEVLGKVGPRGLRRIGKKLHKLTQILGDDHDLASLRARLDSQGLAETTAAPLVQSIERQREELQQRAFKLGKRLFQDSPRAWFARLRG